MATYNDYQSELSKALANQKQQIDASVAQSAMQAQLQKEAHLRELVGAQSAWEKQLKDYQSMMANSTYSSTTVNPRGGVMSEVDFEKISKQLGAIAEEKERNKMVEELKRRLELSDL